MRNPSTVTKMNNEEDCAISLPSNVIFKGSPSRANSINDPNFRPKSQTTLQDGTMGEEERGKKEERKNAGYSLVDQQFLLHAFIMTIPTSGFNAPSVEAN